MYKGRFDKESGRSTADLLRERAAQSSGHTAPVMPPMPQQPPILDFSPEPEALVFPQAPQEPEIPEFMKAPREPIPEAIRIHDPHGEDVMTADQPREHVTIRPAHVPGQQPLAPAPSLDDTRIRGNQIPPEQVSRPVPPMPPRPAVSPNGMPIHPRPQAGGPQRPKPPRNPGMPMGPGGTPIRSGFQQDSVQRPPQNPGPRPDLGPGGIPLHPGQRPQKPGPGAPQAGRPGKPEPKKPQPPQAPVKSTRKSSVVFYACYFAFVFLFFVVTFLGLTWLKGWLIDYEASQPIHMAEQIFQSYFVDPNWGLLFDNSTSGGMEGRDSYVSSMEQKVGNSQLTFQETSAGLSGDQKYFIRLGDENVASFTLVADESAHSDVTSWNLSEIDLMLTHDNSYRIQMLEGHTAYVNGKALDDSHTIMKASTMAQQFLPTGTKGIRIWTQQVDNLIGKPQVRIEDEKGKEMEVLFDEDTNTFVEQTQANTITPEQEEAAVGAAKVYGRYMIAQAGRGELAKYFDASSKIYSTIRDSEKIVQQSFFSSYDFGDAQILDFFMYSDDLFSAHVNVTLNVTRKDGTIKPFPIDTTLFFSLHPTGKWLAYDMTNEDVTQPIGQVRLTFRAQDGTEIASDFYDTNATELDTPMITVPEGKIFSGWVREKVSEEGKKVLEVVFTPDETGHVTLSGTAPLEPMVLTPLFENQTPEGGTQ